jgi:hypothetical protein
METAVEWLIQELKENSLLTFDEWKELFEKAKEMEKEQIIETYNKAHSDGYKDIDKFGEQYYNKTFKSE